MSNKITVITIRANMIRKMILMTKNYSKS